MRYLPSEPRFDNPAGVMEHANRYKGGKALIVLGGPSAKGWEELYAEVNPDVIIGANGVNAMIQELDYWLICENMTRQNGLAFQGDPDGIKMMEMFHRDAGAKYKMVSWHSWQLLRDTRNCIAIRRQGYELDEMEAAHFSFREYGQGYLGGNLCKHKEAWKPMVNIYTGTVGLQCLHHAGILGCSEVHTIGFDLMFSDPDHHHAYDHPRYQVDRYRTAEMFVDFEGVKTQWFWIETANYLKTIEPLFGRDGITWRDHSKGLLSVMGLECAR